MSLMPPPPSTLCRCPADVSDACMLALGCIYCYVQGGHRKDIAMRPCSPFGEVSLQPATEASLQAPPDLSSLPAVLTLPSHYTRPGPLLMRYGAFLVLTLLALLPLLAHAFRLPSTSTPSSSSLRPRAASPNDDESNPAPPTVVDRLFSLFFGAKEAKPLGFDRISVEKSPEVYPATTTKFADPVPGDRCVKEGGRKEGVGCFRFTMIGKDTCILFTSHSSLPPPHSIPS